MRFNITDGRKLSSKVSSMLLGEKHLNYWLNTIRLPIIRRLWCLHKYLFRRRENNIFKNATCWQSWQCYSGVLDNCDSVINAMHCNLECSKVCRISKTKKNLSRTSTQSILRNPSGCRRTFFFHFTWYMLLTTVPVTDFSQNISLYQGFL